MGCATVDSFDPDAAARAITYPTETEQCIFLFCATLQRFLSQIFFWNSYVVFDISHMYISTPDAVAADQYNSLYLYV